MEVASEADGVQAPSLADLPDHLLLHIISLLPAPDAIGTAFICRKFRYLWTLSPSLDLDHRHFGIQPPASTAFSRLFFLLFVDQILILLRSPALLRLCLRFNYEPYYSCYVDSWLRFAAARSVQVLKLDFSVGRNRLKDGPGAEDPEEAEPYNFPLYFVAHVPLAVLKLRLCSLTFPHGDLQFPLLKALSLHHVTVSDGEFAGLFSGCPLLEELTLNSCYEIQHLRIVSDRIKKLKIMHYSCEEESSVVVSAPNLEKLWSIHYVASHYQFRELGSLVDALIFFSPCQKSLNQWGRFLKLLSHVKKLHLVNYVDPDEGLILDVTKDIVLSNLNFLEIRSGYSDTEFVGITELLKICPNVQTLVLDLVMNDPEDFEKYGCYKCDSLEKCLIGNVSQLRTVVLNYFRGTRSELEFLKYLFKHGLILQKVRLISASKTFGEYVPPEILAQQVEQVEQFPRVSLDLKILLE